MRKFQRGAIRFINYEGMCHRAMLLKKRDREWFVKAPCAASEWFVDRDMLSSEGIATCLVCVVEEH